MKHYWHCVLSHSSQCFSGIIFSQQHGQVNFNLPKRGMSRGPYKTEPKSKSGLRLRQLRNDAGYTQEQVADLIDSDQSAISKHESGAITLDERQLRRYAEIYNIPISELFEDSERLSDDERDLIDYLRTHPRDKSVLMSTYRGLRESNRSSDYEAE